MGERARIALVCEACGARNYQTTKRRTAAGVTAEGQLEKTVRLEKKKFCPTCNAHQPHKESK